ncbi:extracellular tyrosine-protein kinase PKDCC isoform X1 [Tachysurus fulvidraco]|uniref:extracellular tyrosine-protein kinase PKDCC isoform X1 n=1 Tax=Tachysurus fulvidraco TaxID=1234273 RepID=UPI000F5130B1|nr:extracellular tyrosine-protein kinase PKDCC isoform X1 [Tachysurus fulvidraco]
MKRRKTMLAAAFCFSFCFGTLMNVLFVPGFEPHQSHDAARQRSFIATQSSRLHISDDFAPGTASVPESITTAALSELRLQIRGRLGEVLRYQSVVEDAAARPIERRRLMDLERANSWNRYRAAEDDHARGTRATRRAAAGGSGGALGCGDLERANSVQFVGSGYTKAVYRAELNSSFSVALKSVDLSGHDMESCVKRYSSTEDCYRLASFKIIKEMTLMERLQHPNILKLYGYCYQDSNDIKDTVTAITELGSPLEMIQLLQTPWEERFRICLSLARLLHYLAHSPLGSLTLLDFRPRQFVLVDGELKVTDLDDASVEDMPCSASSPTDCSLQFPARNFTLSCSSGYCQGINEKRNLYNAYRFFFTYLLPHSAPSALRPFLATIVNSTGELLWDTDETLAHLEKVLEMYRNGHYLLNVTQRHKTTEYKQLEDMTIPGENYRCWPSYQHDRCMLSVYSVDEAIGVCESHAQCRAFIITNQSTWTGHQLVLFKTGFSTMAPDKGKLMYIRLDS